MSTTVRISREPHLPLSPTELTCVDSSVSRPIDPQSVVTSSAYLLFYRRRSDRPLGGKILEEITESSTRPVSESESESRGQSPSGNGQRLDGSSRNGSSSALAGVGAAHQPGDGGLPTGAQAKNRNDDSPPEYSDHPSSGEKRLDGDNRLEGMIFDDEPEFGYGGQSDPFRLHSQPPFWSFDADTDAHGQSQMTTMFPGSTSDDDDLLDDDASNKAVGDMSDSEMNLISLADTPAGHGVYPGTPMEEVPVPGISLSTQTEGDDDDDELPVVELRVDED